MSLFLRLRFSNKYIVAYVGNRNTHLHAKASSQEKALRDRMVGTCSLEAAQVVGITLAERMKKKQILRAKFNIEDEYGEKEERFHAHVAAIAETLKNNGITLF